MKHFTNASRSFGRTRISALALVCAGLGAFGIGYVVHEFNPRTTLARGGDLAARIGVRPQSLQAGRERSKPDPRRESRSRRTGPAQAMDPLERAAYDRLLGEIGRPAHDRGRLRDWAALQARRIQDYLAAYPRSARAFESYHWLLVNQIDVLGRFARADETLAKLESLIETTGGEGAESARARALRLRVRLFALWSKPDREQAAIRRLLPVAGNAERRMLHGRLYELNHLIPGRTLPDARGKDLKRELITPRIWSGKVLCLTFWDLGDPNMEQDFRCRVQARTAYADQGLVLVDVPLSRSRANVEGYLGRLRVDWPQMWDDRQPGNDHAVARRFTPSGRPTNFLVDRSGVIRGRDLRGRALLGRIEELLRVPVGPVD